MNDRKTIDFLYYGENGNEGDSDSKHTFRVNNVPPFSSIDLVALNNTTLRCVPDCKWNQGGNQFQTCQWFIYKDEKISVGLFHERDFFPYSFFKKPIYSYWLCDFDFPTVQEAISALFGKGCDATKWHCQRHFYMANGYFLITHDFDEALKFCGYRYVEDLACKPEDTAGLAGKKVERFS